MGCTKKLLTLDNSVVKFAFRNAVRITNISVYVNGADTTSIWFNGIEYYDGVSTTVPAGIELGAHTMGFLLFPLDIVVTEIWFKNGLDVDARVIVTYNEM